MFQTFFAKTYRERRRLALLALLAFPSGYLLYAPLAKLTAFGMPVPVYAGLLYTGALTAAALLTCLFLPSLRFTIEAIAMGRLALAALLPLAPDLAATLPTSPFTQATLIVASGCLVLRFTHGRWTDALMHRRAPRQVVHLSSRLDADTLLAAFRPAPKGSTEWVLALRGQTTPDPTLSRLIEGSVDPGTVASVDLRPAEGFLRIYHRSDRGRAPLWQEVRIEDRGSYRKLTLAVAHAPMPWHSTLTAWLDDSYGRLADRRVALAALASQPALAVDAAQGTALSAS